MPSSVVQYVDTDSGTQYIDIHSTPYIDIHSTSYVHKDNIIDNTGCYMGTMTCCGGNHMMGSMICCGGNHIKMEICFVLNFFKY